jgi:GWxTD domain-containing protein
MNVLTPWIQSPAARALGWTLFHFLWEGIAIAAILAIVLVFLRGSRVRYGAACIALAAMLIACAGTFVRVLPDQPAPRHVPVKRLAKAPAGNLPPVAPKPFRAEDLLPWAAPVWMAGVLLLHLRTMAGWLAVRRLRRCALAVPGPWQRRLAELAEGVRLSVPVALLETCRVDVPVVIGYLRPAILMPLGLLAGMPADHLEAILLHELAHIRRRDYLVNLLQTVAENLLFYHPAVWWISGVIRAERENCCDDLVVAVRGDAHRYAVALTALESRRITGEPALAATGGDLMKRIHRLLDRPEPPHAALTPAFSAGLILLTAAVALAAWQPTPQEQVRQQKGSVAASPYQRWLTEDVAYIITDHRERAAFKALPTDDEREKFIEQFWSRRDPTPGTVENEFKEEHYRRIAYTNGKYGDNNGLAGWKTDRGRVYITYGPPDEIESHPSGSVTMRYPTEQWLYHHIQGVGENVIVEFVDQARNGLYRMTSDPAGPKGGNVVARSALWPDTVKRGDMVRQVRGLGVLGPNGAVEVKFSPASIQELSMGKVANVDLRTSLASGRVARISPESGVTVQLDAPTSLAPGAPADVSVTLETLRDVVYVGRPVYAAANTQGALFRLDPDGRTATLVPVRFGRTSVNQIEVVSGLAPGDRVILSDMTAYLRFGKVEIQ